MNKIVPISLLFFLIGTVSLFAQVKKDTVLVVKDTSKLQEIDPLTPAKAAFYSAILPGLGQAYNKKYWKIPLVYGAIGTSLYFYLDNNKKYHDYRDAYKRRLEGYTDDKYKFLDESRLVAGQKFYQRNRDLSALFVVGFYVLNIIDANVDAALIQFNVNERLSLRPEIYPDDVTFRPNVGLTFNYHF
ncbi:hypothetical protein BC749_10619 [Flavobacterium araucananum]|uniref:DUF5683 domain-containing protein n=1 Tax=Flavobacterium araucananum TaxID=946678 RepID=A0A227PHK8_9FLAO|nr:DUF5683 domain-containing protein [Flavobacterium araucananum]OXG08884.1 hypothetical protein B0A64_05555 [Flavobacterium araucananum]PWJ97614.1 hypothetical protein BC749_10619 [Flavobacterium araucananum]